MMEAESQEVPPLFEDLLTQVEGGPGDKDSDGMAISDLLDRGDMEEDEEDDSTFPAQQSRPPSATDMGAKADSDLYEVPFKSKLPTKGCSKLEIHGMEELELSGPPVVESSVASTRIAVLYLPPPTFPCPVKWIASAHPYTSAWAPNPVLWDEICVVHNLVLRSSRGAAQGCGRVMGLAVSGERALWLNLSGLGDTQKAEVMDAPFDPTKGLFGPALEKMRETSTLRKQEDEAFNLCLPHRQVPCPPQAGQQSFAATAVRAKQGGIRAQRSAPAAKQANQRPKAANPGPWGKHSFAAAAATTPFRRKEGAGGLTPHSLPPCNPYFPCKKEEAEGKMQPHSHMFGGLPSVGGPSFHSSSSSRKGGGTGAFQTRFKVSPSTQFRGQRNKECTVTAWPRAKGDVLPTFRNTKFPLFSTRGGSCPFFDANPLFLCGGDVISM
ncbi:hypothetical protein AOLI_G00046780 [Acnodon oligacanthus]